MPIEQLKKAVAGQCDFPSSAPTQSVDDFNDVQAYFMFIGHPRSGHSLLGSLLDAHPEIVIAHEFNALKFIQQHPDRNQLFSGLRRRSQWFSRTGRKWNGYKYKVPNQWHGRYSKLKIIGDKMGGSSTDILGRVPNLLRELREIVKVPIKICHVIRNPFDNIRTISRFYHRNNLDPAIEKYFSRCLIVQKIRQDVNPRDWIDIHHEDIIASPEQTLAATCHFLGISAAPDYLKDCASIVFKEPRRRRFDVAWTQAQRQQVESSMGKHEYLSRYSFET